LTRYVVKQTCGIDAATSSASVGYLVRTIRSLRTNPERRCTRYSSACGMVLLWRSIDISSKSAVVQKSSQGSGRINLMCLRPAPSYQITLRSNRSSKRWTPRQRRCSNTWIYRFLWTIPCSPRSEGANTGSQATRTPERRPSLLLSRHLRSASDCARTPQRGCLAAVWLRESAVPADTLTVHH